VITGGIKFFEKSKCLFVDGATITATSGDASASRALDKNSVTHWRSVGASDGVTETLIITFDGTESIDRILLTDHNWKTYTVKYLSSGIYVNFANVVTLNGATQSNISETTYALNSSYYEFTQVTTTSLEITVTNTQTVDAEKYISRIVATSELGTLTGYPGVASMTQSRNTRVNKMLSGKDSVQKSEESVDFQLVFKDYPASFQSDLDLMVTLFEREDNFLVWLCGGRYGSDYFRYAIRGFRLQDLYEMQIDKDFDISYSDNVYINQINQKISFTEAV